jgi:hypothetical protein
MGFPRTQNSLSEHPEMTECIQAQLRVPFHRNRRIVAQFDGGQITSDAGLLPLRQFDERHGLSRRWAAALSNTRAPERLQHTPQALLTQRIYQIVAGYEDANDAGLLRHDPIFQLLVEAPAQLRAHPPLPPTRKTHKLNTTGE